MRQCTRIKKGNKFCRCNKYSNTPNATGTQQHTSETLVEAKVEELLHDDSLWREYEEVCVSDKEGGGSTTDEDDV
jgi:hypothetical protein